MNRKNAGVYMIIIAIIGWTVLGMWQSWDTYQLQTEIAKLKTKIR